MMVGRERRRHGDPFPLNGLAMREHAMASECFEPQRAQWIGNALNNLALHDSNYTIFHILTQSDSPMRFKNL